MNQTTVKFFIMFWIYHIQKQLVYFIQLLTFGIYLIHFLEILQVSQPVAQNGKEKKLYFPTLYVRLVEPNKRFLT